MSSELLIVYDGTFKKYQDNYYNNVFTENSIKRYYELSYNISIMARVAEVYDSNEIKKYDQVPEKIHVIPMKNLMSLKGMLFSYIETRKLLEKQIQRCDMVVARLAGFNARMAADICNKNGKPCIVECVGNVWEAYWNYSIVGKMVAPFGHTFNKKVISQAKYVIYVTNTYLQEIYPTKGKSISASNAVIECSEEDILKKRQDKILNRNEKLIIGTIGPVNIKYKGQSNVIKALAKLKDLGYDFTYELVGSGSNERLLKIAEKYGIENQVVFRGVLSHEKIFEWLDNVDIYIQPSDTEGLPRSVVEAMSRACPIICSSAGGMKELISSQWIFRRKKYKELIPLLLSMDSTKQEEEAEKNIRNSAEYRFDVINNRRNEFYKEFLLENSLSGEYIERKENN